MPESDDPKAEASAEKAYAAATEAVTDTGAPANAEPVESSDKPKRGRKPRAATSALEEPVSAGEPVAEEVAEELPAEPAIEAPVAEPAPLVDAAPVKEPAVRSPRGVAKAAKPMPKPAKLIVKRVAAKPVPAAPGKAAPINIRKPSVQKIKTASKVAPKSVSVADAAKMPLIKQLKEIPMDMTATVTDAVAGAQEKAKEAISKTTALAGEYGEFAKGNVEAFVESGKILAAGLQDMGSKFIAEGKSALETLTADVKELSSVKSPTDLFKLQTQLLRRNFDTAVAYSSKTSEDVLKLTKDVIAPISGRVSLAVEKVKKAA